MVINYSTDVNYNSIIYFASFLSKKLEQMAEEKLKQENLSSNKDIENSKPKSYADEIDRLKNLETRIPHTMVNPIKIKGTALKLKREILNILKDLQTEDLNLLKPSIEQYLLEHEIHCNLKIYLQNYSIT